MGEYIRAPKGWYPQNGKEPLGTLYHHTLTRLLSPLTVLVLHSIKQAGSSKVPAWALWVTSACWETLDEAMVHRQLAQIQITTVNSTHSSHLKGTQEMVYSAPKMSDYSLRTQSQVASNMFQYGSSCVNFYMLTGQQQKVLNGDIYQMHWWNIR